MSDEETTAPLPHVPPFPEDDATFAALAHGADLENDTWPSRPRRRGVSMRAPTAVLVALVIAAGAFWIGASVQKSDGTSSAASTAAGIRSAFRGAFGGTGSGSGAFGGSASAFAPAAEGTLTAVVGNTLYLTSSSGALVKVQLSPSTTITRETNATAKTLQPGDTIVVRGASSSSGTVSATSVTATAKGVAASASGFAGAFGRGALGAAGSTGTGATSSGAAG